MLHCGTHPYLSFWVAEKSDGVRVLLLVQTDPSGDQMVYLVRASSPRPCPARRHSRTSRARARPQIDRHNSYRQLNGLYFPHHEDPRMPLRNSLVDGELVVDVDPHTRQVRVRHLPPSPPRRCARVR